MRWVVYVDMDAFYLSCELLRHSELRGKPAMVAHDPKEGKGRGVVLSASYEARALGFRSAMPVKQAWLKRDQVVWLPPDFEFYEGTSLKVLDRLRERSELVRSFSIDEAAYPLEGRTQVEALREGKEVQRVLREELSLPSSVGIASNLSVAKVASDKAKPGGVVVIANDEVTSFLGPLPVKALPGIGPVTARALDEVGVKLVSDLTRVPRSQIVRAIGAGAGSYIRLAKGDLPEEPWPEDVPRRSTGSMVTFDEDLFEESPLLDQVARLGGALSDSLLQRENLFRGVTVQVRWGDLERVQRSRSLSHPTDDEGVLISTARALLHQILNDPERRSRGVRTLGLTIHDLRPRDPSQRKLEI